MDNAFSGLAPAQLTLLLRALLAEQKRLGFAILAATMTAEMASGLGGRTVVMRDGRIVAQGSVEELSGSANSYTQSFFKSAAPASQMQRALGRGEPVLKAVELLLPNAAKKSGRSALSFELRKGNVLALVGDEGSGRRGLVRTLLGLEFAKKDAWFSTPSISESCRSSMMSRLRRRVAISRAPTTMLDPRMSLWDTVAEPLRAHLHLRGGIVANYRDVALKRVGLDTLPGIAGGKPRRLRQAPAAGGARHRERARACRDRRAFRGLDAFRAGRDARSAAEFPRAGRPCVPVDHRPISRVAQTLADEAMVMNDGRIIERGALADYPARPKDAYTSA